jgi:hypothetical protein
MKKRMAKKTQDLVERRRAALEDAARASDVSRRTGSKAKPTS